MQIRWHKNLGSVTIPGAPPESERGLAVTTEPNPEGQGDLEAPG